MKDIIDNPNRVGDEDYKPFRKPPEDHDDEPRIYPGSLMQDCESIAEIHAHMLEDTKRRNREADALGSIFGHFNEIFGRKA